MLDPFIARYIKSLSLIGVHTFYSCDGWHSHKEKSEHIKIGFSDCYSLQWLMVLHNLDSELNSNNLPYNIESSTRLSIPLENRMKAYIDINNVAKTIYEKRAHFRTLKSLVVNRLKGLQKNNLSYDEIYELLKKSYLLEAKQLCVAIS